jgi:hypothetical protein
MKDTLLEEFTNYLNEGSNWRFKEVKCLEVLVDKSNPLRGSSYKVLPKFVQNKKAVINIKNDDNQCFKWCLLRAVNPASKNAERISDLRSKFSTLNWGNMSFPVKLKDIGKFEKLNPNYAVNVFGLDGTCIYPLRNSNVNTDNQINLLSHDDHYSLINNFGRLVNSQISKHKAARFYCYRCLNSFTCVNALKTHKEYCEKHCMAHIDISEDPVVFKNHHRIMRVSFVIYADFETFNVKIDTCQPNASRSYTEKIMKQVPSSFCFYAVSVTGEKFKPVIYIAQNDDDDIGAMFNNVLIEYAHMLYNKYERYPKATIITESEQAAFEQSTHCYICKQKLMHRHEFIESEYEEFKKKGLNAVRDYCHLTGLYRGAAHSSCNLKCQSPNFYPVIIHNLSGFDAQLFIKELKGKIRCIPSTDEKYISFTREVVVGEYTDKTGKKVAVIRNLRFIDSYRFMPASLDSLLKNLKTHPHLSRFYQGEQFEQLLKKGIYPYEYVDSYRKFDETQLPPKEAFYSQLNGYEISDEDYAEAQNAWKVLGCKTFRDYHNHYNTADVLQLADIFESFRDVCIKNYKLDPAWYFTASGLAWDSCLKLTGITLELPQTYEEILMIKAGTRGGNLKHHA